MARLKWRVRELSTPELDEAALRGILGTRGHGSLIGPSGLCLMQSSPHLPQTDDGYVQQPYGQGRLLYGQTLEDDDDADDEEEEDEDEEDDDEEEEDDEDDEDDVLFP